MTTRVCAAPPCCARHQYRKRQRVGRFGHRVDGMPKGRLFPPSRDDMVECAAPLDVLAQQIVAEVTSTE
jgi:ATP-dependent Lhr-like helicase